MFQNQKLIYNDLSFENIFELKTQYILKCANPLYILEKGVLD